MRKVYYIFLSRIARDKLPEWHNLLESKLQRCGVNRIVYEYRRTMQNGETDFVIRLLDRDNKTMGRFHLTDFKCRKLYVEYKEYESDKQVDKDTFEQVYIETMCEVLKEYNYKETYLKIIEDENQDKISISN